jgi:hypothetical protein
MGIMLVSKADRGVLKIFAGVALEELYASDSFGSSGQGFSLTEPRQRE